MTSERKRFWTAERLLKAKNMAEAGKSYREIGLALGKTEGAVKDAMNRFRDRKASPGTYLKGYDGPAIGWTTEDFRLRESAIIGSQALRDAILRAFPERRAA